MPIRLSTLIMQKRIEMDAAYHGKATQREPDGHTWEHYVWIITLRCGNRSMVFPYRMGLAFQGQRPTKLQVLGCVVMDAQSVVWDDFEGWCGNFGYDSDSRRAEDMYWSCEKTLRQLSRLLEMTHQEIAEIDTQGY